MSNTTQCPHCMTTFIITDEEYRISNGSVTCGTCQKKFKVTFLADSSDEYLDPEIFQQSINLEIQNTHGNTNEPPDDQFSSSDELINEVDHLINEKLLHENLSHDTQKNTNDSFSLKPSKASRIKSFFAATLLIAVCFIASITLVYQLWQKQIILWPQDKQIELIKKIATPVTSFLSNKFDITLPKRRNLNQLQLLSAKTEAHPTRASIILLRVNFINHAKISQSLPWIELSLTNEDGRLVSRRALSPKDYLYNNRTDDQIAANALKRITIELLAFPEQAKGYELKLLNN